MKKITLLAAVLFATLSYGQDLVQNGGFENWTGAVLDNWTSESGTTITEETSIVAEGSKSVKVTLTTGKQSNTDFRNTMDVVAGKTYTISVKVYHVAGDDDGRTRLYVDGWRNYSNPSEVDKWQTVTYDYEATETKTIEVGLRFYDLSGFDGTTVMYIDNYTASEQTLSNNKFNTIAFNLFPNPAKSIVNIITNGNINISVYNVMGQKVLASTNKTLNVSSLSPGIYLVEASQNGATSAKKLVIK